MSNVYSELHVHMVWHTKDSLPLLNADIEKAAHNSLRARCIEEQGVFVHEVGGTETHVHLCITYPPTLTLSTFIGQLKGRASHDVNNRSGRRQAELQWQIGYGVVSFGTGDLDWVKRYIKNQREHHQRESAQDRLERITRFDA